MDTAKIVLGDRKVKIITDPGLCERNLGVLCGKIINLTDVPADTLVDMSKDKIDMPAILLFNGDYVPENGESDNMFVHRINDTITKIVKNTNAKTIGVATHAGVISVFVRLFTNFNFSSMPNAEYIKMQWNGEKFSLLDPPDWLLKTQSNQE